MILRSLTIYGFKSFAEKTTIQLDEGITSIVGPNGCGKSNVVDAVRWVFGEQKASALRSAAMQDVIFSGSQKRQPLNFAEVTLTIENNKGILQVDYSQVAITRRLWRSGESEYMLNKVPCRLRDIQDLFTDTGIGSSAYTTIENNMISLILSDKADERRMLFDEAAGIGKYKNRRKESQRQLERTSQDLLRINDMVQEADRQVRMLARHVEKAQRYKRYHEDLKSLELGFENGHYRALSQRCGERAKQLEEHTAGREIARAKVATEESEIEKQQLSALEKEEELGGCSLQVSEAGERINTLDREISVGQERLRGLEETLVRLGQETDQLVARIERNSGLRVQFEKSLVERTTRREQCGEKLAGARMELERFDGSIGKARAEADGLSQEQIANLKQVSDSRNRLSNLEANLSNSLERADRLTRDMTAIETRISQYSETIDKCHRELASVSDAHERLMQSRETLLARIEKEDESYQNLVEREKKCEAQMDSGRSQLRFLEGLDAAFEGYESGVKALLTGNLPGMLGTAADSLQVSDPTTIALVERVLGTAIQTVVFERDEHLAAALGILAEKQAGAARMVSLERLAAIGGHSGADQLGTSLRGLVATVPGREALADYLLGQVRVVESAAEAFQASRSSARTTVFVARDGAVCWGDGTVVAGRGSKDEAGLLHRKAKLEQLRRDQERLEKDFQSIIREKEVCIINRDEAKYALVEVDERISSGRQVQQEQETTIRHHEHEIVVSQERLEEYKAEAGKNREAMAELEEGISVCRQNLTQAQTRQQQLEQQVETARETVGRMQAERQAMAEHLKNIELETHALDGFINQTRSDVERLGREIAEDSQRKQTILGEQHAATSGIGDQQALLASLREELVAARDRRAQLEQVMAVVREAYNGMLHRAEEMRKQVRIQQAELEQVGNTIHQLELAQSQDEQEMRRIRERMWESYEVDLESPAQPIAELVDDENTVTQNIAMYKERIKRVGPVSMAALEDFETESERLRQLTTQRDDLQTAVDDLEKAIKKLDREARQQFVATFEQVQKNFAEMFTTLFEGGEATLSLEENVDPLEANIMINARPAGKKMRGVGPLSGGERALTAIALLFGLYMVKPSAYCVLDELDAPLDEANTERFLRVLRRFADKTQFIVITHNKRTMEAADLLYGVTQQERGISQIVSVKLAEAVLQAA